MKDTMETRQRAAVASLALITFAGAALAHDCQVRNGYLRGSYEGGCNEKIEMAQGHGEAKGADRYVGNFENGRLDGAGVYTWESGARLEGTFKADKAEGAGVYVSAKGVRYAGPFHDGKLVGAKPEDCPTTQGPLNC